MRCLFTFMCILALGVMGCSETSGEGGSGGSSGTGGMPECQSPEDCYDANDCTVDACADAMCEHTALEDGNDCFWTGEMAGGLGLCVAGFCEAITRCEEDADCNFDGNDCTTETCLSNGLCEEVGLVEDGTPCAGGTCQGGVCVLESSVVPCSEQGIRNAIAAGGGPYTLNCDEPTTVLVKATIGVDNDVVLNGSGVTLDGNDEQRVLFSVGATAELRAFTLTRGGIRNDGTLTLVNSTLSRSLGLGIDNDAVVTVVNSTVSGATIFNEGSLTLINSTLSMDVASEEPVLATGPLREDRDYLTVIAGCVIRGSCLLDQALTSNGYNVESPGSTCGFDQPTDQVSVPDPMLGPLQNNGGPTETHALLPGSVAIDQIPAEDCEVTEDQRGQPRPAGPDPKQCDVGSFEVQPAP